MISRSGPENRSNLPYKELSVAEEHHFKKQMYYFFPFLRQTYEALRRQKERGEVQPIRVEILRDIKRLACYYGFGLIYGDFNLDLEQALIGAIFYNSGLPKQEFKKRVLAISQNTFNKSDGNLRNYFFGDVPPKQLAVRELADGPLYNMGLGEGIAVFKQKDRFDLVQSLATFIKANSKSLSISILGNVARGVIDASALYAGLQRNGVSSQIHLYRVSSNAMEDTKAILLGESLYRNSWAIAVDSFTAKGRSIPLSIKLLDDVGFKKKSVFLTHFGREWVKELGVEFQWANRHGEDNWAGTLLGGSMKKSY